PPLYPYRVRWRRLRHLSACANPYPSCLLRRVAPHTVLRHSTRRFRIVNMVLANSPVAGSAPCRIRTCDLVLRRHPLWSTELRGRRARHGGSADYKDVLRSTPAQPGPAPARLAIRAPRAERPKQGSTRHPHTESDSRFRPG